MYLEYKCVAIKPYANADDGFCRPAVPLRGLSHPMVYTIHAGCLQAVHGIRCELDVRGATRAVFHIISLARDTQQQRGRRSMLTERGRRPDSHALHALILLWGRLKVEEAELACCSLVDALLLIQHACLLHSTRLLTFFTSSPPLLSLPISIALS